MRGWYSPITAHAGRASHEETRTHFRLYPSSGQRQALAFGCARVVDNDALHARREAWAGGRRKLADANPAHRNWLSSRSGKRKGRKIGDVLVRWYRDLPGEPPSVTVIMEAVILEAAGRYFASFVVDTADAPLPPVDAEVGIDLGLMSFAVLSNGRVVDNLRYLRKAERRVDPREPSG